MIARVLGAIAALFALCLLALSGWLGWRVVQMRDVAPERVAAILAGADPAVAAISPERRAWLVRIEDPTFWTNDGLDFASPGAGMTTLSQGLAKDLFFEDFAPGLAKLDLIATTKFALSPKVSKDDILDAVLASAYLGHSAEGPVRGFPAGARVWFGKELGTLDDREFLGLVGMMMGPNILDPIRHPDAHAERVRRIEAHLAGACAPMDWRDVALDGCAGPTP